MGTLLCWLRSSAAYLLLGLYLALVAPPAFLYSYVTARPGVIVVLGRFAVRWLRRLLGVRLRLEGFEHVVSGRPTVYCINHRSMVDVVAFEAVSERCPRLRGLYKAELERVPILGIALRLSGFVRVERAHRSKAIEAADFAADRLRAGDSIMLAPEGTRSVTGELLPLKKGAFVMAIKAQVPVVPVAIVRAAEAMPRGQWWVRPTLVRIVAGALVPTAGLSFDDRDRLAAAVRESLQRLLAG